MKMLLLLYCFLVVILVGSTANGQEVEYGVDCSFPIHYSRIRCDGLLGDRQQIYEEYMNGCRQRYGSKGYRCDGTEQDRMDMSIRQPQSMVNYTSMGYKKIKAPKPLFDLLSAYWEANKDDAVNEKWFIGNIYTNHWAAPTYLVSVEDTSLRGGGFDFKEKIFRAAISTVSEWVGQELKPTSMYGIRKYTTGAILSPHVDRLPLVSSCIVNIDQDVDEPWPLEVIDRSGKAVNITMEPGDMVLYESGSLIHGHPFPLKGRYHASIFIHFEPTGRKLGDTTSDYLDDLDDFYPPYLLPNSPELPHWKKLNPHGWYKPVPSAPIHQANSPEAHVAAAFGDIHQLKAFARRNKQELFRPDALGWQPIHEAARGGHKDVLKFLIDMGADKDARTGIKKEGSSPLNLVLAYFGPQHEAAKYLWEIGAKNLAEVAQEL